MPDPGGQRRLAVALADLAIGAAKPARPVSPFPAEQAADDKFLAFVQCERPAFELPAIQAQHVGEEADRPVRRRQVPGEPARGAALEVRQMAPAGVPDMRPGGDLPGVPSRTRRA